MYVLPSSLIVAIIDIIMLDDDETKIKFEKVLFVFLLSVIFQKGLFSVLGGFMCRHNQ